MCESPFITVIYDLHEAVIQVRPFLLHVYPSSVSLQMWQLEISTAHIRYVVYSLANVDAKSPPRVNNLQSVS